MAVHNEHYNYISRGFPIGFVTPPSYKQPNKHCLYNHVRIVVKFNENPALFQGSRIVGFEVVPFSIKHKWDNGNNEEFHTETTLLHTCNDMNHVKYEPEGFQVRPPPPLVKHDRTHCIMDPMASPAAPSAPPQSSDPSRPVLRRRWRSRAR